MKPILTPPPKVPFLFENARKFFFLRCRISFSGMLAMICANFSLVLKSVNETYFDPPKVPFLSEYARKFFFLRCRISFCGMLTTICENFSLVLRSVNETHFWGVLWGLPPLNARNAERKKCLFCIP